MPRFLRAALLLLLLPFVVGCDGAGRAEAVFALTERYEPQGDFEASVLLRVDAKTLQPHAGEELRLGDAVTSRALGPDGRTLAFGGYNDGEVLFVDLEHPTHVDRFTVSPKPRDGVGEIVSVLGWLTRTRLVAVATTDGAWWAPHPSRLLIVDVRQRRIVRARPLRGGMLSWLSLRDHSVVILGERRQRPTLLVLRPDSSTWRIRLDRIELGSGQPVTVAGVSYGPERIPALASDGRARVYVAAADRPIAEIDTQTRAVRYHALRLPRRYLAYPPSEEPGSGGVNLRFATSATYYGDDQLGIGGYDEIPAFVRGYGGGHRFLQRQLQIINTHTWRLVRTIPATDCERATAVTLCHAVASGYPPDGKGARGLSLIAFSRHWRRVYTKPQPLWWDLTGGYLLAGNADGSRVYQLEPTTGRIVHKITPSPLRASMWPLELFSWSPG